MSFKTAKSPFVQFTLLSLRPYFREPHVLFWVFGFPLMMTVVLTLAFSSNSGRTPLTLAVYETTAENSKWVDAIENAPEIKTIHIEAGQLQGIQLAEALSQLNSVDKLPPALKDIFLIKNADVLLANGELYSIRDRAQFQTQWDQLMALKAQSYGIESKTHHVQAPGVRYVDWFVPGILALSMLTNGLFGVTFTIVSNREQGFYKRLRLAPFQKQTYIAAFSFARLIMVSLQLLILLGVFYAAYHFRVQGSFVAFFAFALLLSFCTNVLGVAIGARIRKTEIAGGFTNLFFFPFSLLSGVFFKSEYFPDWMQSGIRLIPLKAGVDVLRGIANKALPISYFGFEVCVVLGWTIAALLFAARYFDWGTEEGN